MFTKFFLGILDTNKKRFGLALLGVIVIAASFLVIENRGLPNYPTGWDTPNYVTRARLFQENHLIYGHRLGSVLLLTFVHLVTGQEIIDLIFPLSIILSLLISGLSASLVWKFTKSWGAFFVVLITTLFSSQTFVLTHWTIDNGLGVICILLSLILFKPKISWLRAACLGATLVYLSITHLESFILAVAVIMLVLVLELWRLRSDTWRQYVKPILFLIMAIGVFVLYWGSDLPLIIKSYAGQSSTAINGTMAYAGSDRLAEIARLSTLMLNSPLISSFSLIGFSVLVWYWIKRKSQASTILAYSLFGPLLIIESLFFSNIPVNRVEALVPVSLLLSLGLFQISRWVKKIMALRIMIFLGIIIIIVIRIGDYHKYINTYPKSINTSGYEGLLDLRQYVKNNHIQNYTLVIEPSNLDRSPGAYYGLMKNWLGAILPLNGEGSNYCLVMGKLVDMRDEKPSARLGENEYNQISQLGIDCVKTLPNGYSVFMINGLHTSAFPLNGWYVKTQVITPNLGLVTFPN